MRGRLGRHGGGGNGMRSLLPIVVTRFFANCRRAPGPAGSEPGPPPGSEARSDQAGSRALAEPAIPIETPEIVRILEDEDIAGIATLHCQSIHIELKNGCTYGGTYEQAEAGKYANDPHLRDIYNLVRHILATRPAEETRGISIACE